MHILKKEDTQLTKRKLNVSTRKLQASPEKSGINNGFKRNPLGEKSMN
jgi:hypothetical protein